MNFDSSDQMGDELLDEFSAYWKSQRITHYMCCPDKEIPATCGFHPGGDECMCFGTICMPCLTKALGFA